MRYALRGREQRGDRERSSRLRRLIGRPAPRATAVQDPARAQDSPSPWTATDSYYRDDAGDVHVLI